MRRKLCTVVESFEEKNIQVHGLPLAEYSVKEKAHITYVFNASYHAAGHCYNARVWQLLVVYCEHIG